MPGLGFVFIQGVTGNRARPGPPPPPPWPSDDLLDLFGGAVAVAGEQAAPPGPFFMRR
jgi:hypothetical protein